LGLMEGAMVTVGTCINVKRKDKVLVISDDNTKRIGEAIYDAALEFSDTVVLLRVTPESLNGKEPPATVVGAMKKATVIIVPTTHSITYTQAVRGASNRGARIATMPGITPRMMSRGGMTGDFRKIARVINRVHKYVRRPKSAHITTELGTDLVMELKGRRWIIDDNGL